MNSTRPNMTEQELLTDFLSQEKQLVKDYAGDVTEASCENLRQLLLRNLTECSSDQLAVFEQMKQRNMYQTKDAPDNEVQSASTVFFRPGAHAQHHLCTKLAHGHRWLFAPHAVVAHSAAVRAFASAFKAMLNLNHVGSAYAAAASHGFRSSVSVFSEAYSPGFCSL